MKANNLMIGDWLKHANGKFYQVTRIDVLSNGDIHYACGTPHLWEYNNKFEPIPLTKEILEKNGFVYKSEGMLYVYYNYAGDGYISIRLSDLLDGEWELAIDNYDKFNDSHIQYTIDRCFLKVHELQHAMKLCGIEKKIQL